MTKILFLTIVGISSMYLAFFAWDFIGGEVWGWSKLPTVMVLTVFSVVHFILVIATIFEKKPKEQ